MIVARAQNEITARETMRGHGLWVAALEIALGIQLLRPGSTFDSASIYKGFALYITEEHLGFLLLALGVLRIAAIAHGARNDLDTRSMTASMALTGVSCLLWVFGAVLFAQINPWGWSCLATLAFAGIDGTTCVKLSRILRTTRDRKRDTDHGRRIAAR